jgi:hypothetical protein
MKWTILVLSFVMIGCADQALDAPMHTWNGWLGQHKDDVVRAEGIPARCVSLRSGEVCEWSSGPGDGDSVTLTLDQQGTVCQWQYRGFYGTRKSESTCPEKRS